MDFQELMREAAISRIEKEEEFALLQERRKIAHKMQIGRVRDYLSDITNYGKFPSGHGVKAAFGAEPQITVQTTEKVLHATLSGGVVVVNLIKAWGDPSARIIIHATGSSENGHVFQTEMDKDSLPIVVSMVSETLASQLQDYLLADDIISRQANNILALNFEQADRESGTSAREKYLLDWASPIVEAEIRQVVEALGGDDAVVDDILGPISGLFDDETMALSINVHLNSDADPEKSSSLSFDIMVTVDCTEIPELFTLSTRSTESRAHPGLGSIAEPGQDEAVETFAYSIGSDSEDALRRAARLLTARMIEASHAIFPDRAPVRQAPCS